MPGVVRARTRNNSAPAVCSISGLHAAQAGCNARDAHRVDHGRRLPPVGVLDQERDHAAKSAHRTPRDLMLRVAGQAGIKHALDAWMTGQELGHALAILIVTLHAQLECLQPAQEAGTHCADC